MAPFHFKGGCMFFRGIGGDARAYLLAGSALIIAPYAHAGDNDKSATVAAATAPGASDAPVADESSSPIIITGIRGGKPRTVAESPAPIDIIQGSQIGGTGRADVAESLSKLLPSINFGTTTAGVNSIVRPIFNRGLGPAYTL